MSTMKTTIPANIPFRSGDGDRFLPRFGAILLRKFAPYSPNSTEVNYCAVRSRSYPCFNEPNRNQTEKPCSKPGFIVKSQCVSTTLELFDITIRNSAQFFLIYFRIDILQNITRLITKHQFKTGINQPVYSSDFHETLL